MLPSVRLFKPFRPGQSKVESYGGEVDIDGSG